ncbi:MAG: hypothetical protein IT395_00765, partial [Candidatus Omnitrophica bacterium]|nr:hypothetical protein [Candidatus Omnitrophota bacterium]
GAYNIIKQDYDLSAQKIVQRKYFSGGANLANLSASTAIKQMSSANVAALSPTAANAVTSAVAEMQRAAQGGGAASNYSRVTVKLSNSSSAVTQQVSARLSLQDGGTATRFGLLEGVRSNANLANLGVNIAPASIISVTPSFVTGTATVQALSSLSREQVQSIATRNGLNPVPLLALHQRVVTAVAKVSPDKKADVMSYYASVAENIMPAARESLVRASDLDLRTVTILKRIGDATPEEFDSATKDMPEQQRADAVYARQQVQALKSGDSLVTLLADERLTTAFDAPDSPAVKAFEKPAKVVVAQAERTQVAVAVAKKQDVNVRVALTKMGYDRDQVNSLMTPQSQPQLVAIVQEKPDAFLSSVNIDPTTAIVLQKVANPYSRAIQTSEQYAKDSPALYNDLAKQGFSPTVVSEVVKVRDALQPIVIANNGSTEVMRTAATSGFALSFNQTLQQNPALARSFVEPSKVELNDTSASQVDMANKLVAMDSDTLDFIVLQNPTFGFTPEQQTAIRADVAEIQSARKQDPKARIFQGQRGQAIARATADPKFVQTLSSVRASSAVSALLAAAYLRNSDDVAVETYYQGRFANDKTAAAVTPQEISAVSATVKKLAAVKPTALARLDYFIPEMIQGLKDQGVAPDRATTLAFQVGGQDIDRFAQLQRDSVASNPSASAREQVNAQAVASFLYDAYDRAYVRTGLTNTLPSGLRNNKPTRAEVDNWVANPATKIAGRQKEFFELKEVKGVLSEISQPTRASSPTTPIQNILASVQVADQAAVPTVAADDKLHEYLTGIATNSTRNAEEKFDPTKTTVSLRAIAFQATKNPAFGERVAGARNVGELTAIVGAEVQADPQFAQNVSTGDLAKLKDADLKQVGGIDLSSDKMGLQIKRDGKGVALPISDQDIKDLRIDGLAPVILDIQPATPTSVPFLMNLANTAQSK